MGEENKKTSPINIRSIKDLLNEKFNIPRYQRGYRWRETQIIELLDDIYVYGDKAYGEESDEKKVGKFYCLQPVVVKRNEQKESGKIWWDLIDGQQRLTTIFIIIKYIQYKTQAKSSLFTIDYETRNKDQNENKGQGCEFLNDITFDPDKKSNTDNIDFYHMDECSKYVEKWFRKHEEAGDDPVGIIKYILITRNQKNVSVIWYEVDANEDKPKDQNDQIDVFKRLNIGKIPLTDSELIKAFLLQGDIYPPEDKYIQQLLFEIAKEWDNIEYHLQNNEMWKFLNNKSYKPESRIDYLFKLLSEDWNLFLDEKLQIEEKDKDEHFEYHVFEKYISMRRRGKENKIEAAAAIFDEIRILFSVLDEWYNDRQMYHYIGFLVCQHEKKDESVELSVNLIKELFVYFLGKRGKDGERLANGHTRDECLDFVKIKIKKIISLKQDQKLEKLNYNYDYDLLLYILLFLNIESTIRLENENTYFPFHLYKEEIPSIEHIEPQTPEEPDCEQCKAWLKSKELTLSSIIKNRIKSDDEIEECKNMQGKINDFIKNLSELPYDKKIKDDFDIISGVIDKLFAKLNGISPDQTDTLSNYALIGKDTNSKLSNNSFQEKRKKIINIIEGRELDGEGEIFNKYIPVCTRNVFQKHYTPQPDNMILWDSKDRMEYFNAMKSIFDEFTEKINTGADK